MRRKNLLLSLTVCLPFGLASCGGGQENRNGAAVVPAASPAATAQTNSAPTGQTQQVKASAEEVKLTAGGAGEASVRLDIAQGYHTHANPATDKYYIATELRAEPQEGITPGRPVYPPGTPRKLAFFDKPLSLYEGSVTIKLPLRADRAAAKGPHTLRAKLRVQPCNDEACLPPRDLDVSIPTTVN